MKQVVIIGPPDLYEGLMGEIQARGFDSSAFISYDAALQQLAESPDLDAQRHYELLAALADDAQLDRPVFYPGVEVLKMAPFPDVVHRKQTGRLYRGYHGYRKHRY